MSLLADYQRQLNQLAEFRPSHLVCQEFSSVHLDMLRVLGVDLEVIDGAQAYLNFKSEYARLSSRIRTDLLFCASLHHKC